MPRKTKVEHPYRDSYRDAYRDRDGLMLLCGSIRNLDIL